MTIERKEIKDRAEWLEWRKLVVGASETPALFDQHPFLTKLKLFMIKNGMEFENIDTPVMRRGRWYEPAVGAAVREKFPEWNIAAANCFLVDTANRIGATPDFWLQSAALGNGILQAKTVTWKGLEANWAGGKQAPLWIQLQLATEMMLADVQHGAIAALVVDAYDPDVFVIQQFRHVAAEDKIRNAVKKFWDDVEAGNEPVPDFERDREIVRALNPREQPGKAVDLSGHNALPAMLAQRARLMKEIKDAEQIKSAIETEVISLMTDAELGQLPGWKITFKSHAVKEFTVPAKEVRPLRITDLRPPEEREEDNEDE
jgi:predicted phage-related endonuclease